MRKSNSVTQAVTLSSLGQHEIISGPRTKSEWVTFSQLKGRKVVQDPVSKILSNPSTMNDAIPDRQKRGQAFYVPSTTVIALHQHL